MKTEYDIIVVGAGPAGSMAARFAAEQGVSVLMLEKDRDIGYPVRCGEAISKVGVEEFIPSDDKWIAAKISKFSFNAPDGTEVILDFGEAGYVLERRIFDYELARTAADAGVEILTRAYVNDLLFDSGKVAGVKYEYHGEQKEVKAMVRTIGLMLVLLPACNIFEPRDPEDPTQSGLNYRPATTPEIVIQNLQSAIDQKNLANYSLCFSDPMNGNRPFEFVASTEASAQYPSVMATWTHAQEESYFRNLIAKSSPTAFSALRLELDNAVVGSDSVTYTYRYTLVFEHNEAGFPGTARGTMQFTLGTDQANIWSIHRWADYKTGEDLSWSMFKGKFSN